MLIKHYIKVYILEILRNKAAAFFTIIFPTVMLCLFWNKVGAGPNAAWGMLIVYAHYAVQTAMLQSLGMGIAFSNHRKWSDYLKTLPVTPVYQVIGRVVAMLLLALLSLCLVLLAGILLLPLKFSFVSLMKVTMVAMLGGIPMGLLGFYLGKKVSAETAKSVFLLLNLGLFFSAFCFPDHGILAQVRDFIPSFQWLNLSFDLVLQHTIHYSYLFGLLSYTVLFYLLAVFGTRK